MVRLLKISLLLFAAGLWAVPLQGQYAVIPRSVLDSLASPPVASGSEAMRFESARINAGTLGEDDRPKQFVFRWRNAGTEPIAVTRVQTSCGCASASYSKEPVLPGRTGQIEITYNPKGHPGKFSRRIMVFTQLSSQQPSAVLELDGEVLESAVPAADYPYACGPLRFKQLQLNMERGAKCTERVACLNAGDRPLRIAAQRQLLPACIRVETEPETLEAGMQGDIVVSYNPALAPEKMPAQIPVLLVGVDGPPARRTLQVRFMD